MKRTLRHEIIGILLLKAVVIGLIWLVWFSHPEDERLDAAQVSAQLLSSHSTTEVNHGRNTGTR